MRGVGPRGDTIDFAGPAPAPGDGAKSWSRDGVGGISPNHMSPAPRTIIVSFVGGGLASGTGPWIAGHDAAVQTIDTSVVRVDEQGACVSDNNQLVLEAV